jgi:hypothetical protein
MSRENTLALVRYRLDQADDAVRAAQVLHDQQLPRDSVNLPGDISTTAADVARLLSVVQYCCV